MIKYFFEGNQSIKIHFIQNYCFKMYEKSEFLPNIKES